MAKPTICLLLGVTLAVQTSWGHASDGKVPSGEGQLVQANTEIQLRAMTVPVNPENPSAKREAPITVTLVLANRDQAFYVCEMTPRLRDSILEALYENPIPVSARNVMDLQRTEALLLQAGNKALKDTILVAVKVKQGTEELRTGSSRSRASALGCGEVEEQQKKQERQQQRG